MKQIHKLLKRQLEKHSININELPPNIKYFINDINLTYIDFEDDKELIERALELSSQELLEKNFELKSIFETIPEILLKTDYQGNILEYYYNKNINFYKKLSSLYNKNISYIFPQQIKKNIQKILTNTIKNKKIFTLEFSTNKEKNFWEALFIPFLNRQVIIIIKNITDRKQIEIELIKNEQKYKRIFEDIPIGLYRIDKNGVIIESNPFFAKLMGYENAKKIIGKNVNEFLYEEDLNYLKLSSNFFQNFKSLEKKYKNINGKIIYTIENIKSVSVNDEVDYFEIVVEDITKLKNSEENLSREKEKLSVTLENIGDCVITTDTKGNILLANKTISNIIKAKPDDIINKNFFDLFPLKKNNENINIQDIFKKIKEQKTIFKLPIDTYLLDENNNKKYIGGTFSPIISKNDTITGIVIILKDITEFKIAERERQKMEKLESIGILAGGIAHDFNNLLTIILGNLELVQLFSQNPKALEKIKIAKNATLKAKYLTQQLLTFSKGGTPIKKTASLKNIILDSAKFLLSGSNIKFSFSFDENLYPVDIDKGQIYQVFNNLLINSIQAMPNGGEIFISAHNVSGEKIKHITDTHSPYVEITIKDTGVGIPEEILNKIFDPYFTTKEEGNGLGLTTVYSIIKKHNGFINVKSFVNKGTIFSIYLPAVTNKPIEKDKLTNKSSKNNQSVGKILVVDDEEAIREFIKTALSFYGFNVFACSNGEEALSIYKKEYKKKSKFDLVIMDLTMPGGMNGKELMKKLKKFDPQIKAIITSGYSNDPVMAKYKEHGFKDIIIKPFTIEELISVVQKILSN